MAASEYWSERGVPWWPKNPSGAMYCSVPGGPSAAVDPSSSSQPLAVLQHQVQRLAPAVRHRRPQQVRAVDPPRDPFLQQEALAVARVVALVDRGHLEHDRLLRRLIDREPHMAAVGAVQLAHD